MKLYKLEMVIGRFQILHKGHEQLISHALELCDKVIVFVGSSQEQRTTKNPFSYLEREEMLKLVFPSEYASKRLIIRPLPDLGVGNDCAWGKYVLDKVLKEFHRLPDLYVTGCEKDRSSWFSNDIAPTTDELRLTRHNIEVSGTLCRNYLVENNYEGYCNSVPYELFDKFELYRNVLNSKLPKEN